MKTSKDVYQEILGLRLEIEDLKARLQSNEEVLLRLRHFLKITVEHEAFQEEQIRQEIATLDDEKPENKE